MNIFLREMKAYRKSLIIWCAGLFVLIAGSMAKYAGFSESGELVKEMLDKLPGVMKAMWGLAYFNLTEMKGYYSVLFLYFVLLATIHAAMLGATIISKEERDKTAEFLLTKPVARNKIISAKLLAAIVNLLIFNMTTLILSFLFVGFYNKGKPIDKEILILMVAMFILQLLFLTVGTALGAVSKKIKRATSLATAILLGTFLLSVYIDMNNRVEKLKYITPFKYFEAKELIFGEGFNIGFIALSLAIIAVLLVITYKFYTIRDINV